MRVINKRAQIAAALLAYLRLKKTAHLFKDNARAVIEYMTHRGVLAVQIANKMLRAHGQGKYGAEIDYLRADRCLFRVLFAQQLQIFARKFAHMNTFSRSLFFLFDIIIIFNILQLESV